MYSLFLKASGKVNLTANRVACVESGICVYHLQYKITECIKSFAVGFFQMLWYLPTIQ